MDKLKNLHSPCMTCFVNGIKYNPNNKICSICEYNFCVQLMKQILYNNNGCSLCKKRKELEGDYWDCKENKQDECGGQYYEIDWEAVENEYKKK